MKAIVALLVLLTGCASVPMPQSVTAFQQIRLKQQVGFYPQDWYVPGTDHAAQYDRLVGWAEDQGIVIADANLDRRQYMGTIQAGVGGWVVLIHQGLTPNGKLYTLLHELGHLYGRAKIAGEDSEVVAEMVTAMACQRLGLNVWPQTTSYLAHRVPSLETQASAVQRYGATIDTVVAKLVTAAGCQQPCQ